jgi:protein-S-isoprenylcysteine O-methyltransferase Ste14
MSHDPEVPPRDAMSPLNAASFAALMVLLVAVLVLLFRTSLFARGPVAIGLQIAGFALVLWARATFGMRSFHATARPTEGGLVTTGPYRFVRHPIYAGLTLIIWAGVLTHGRMLDWILAGVITVGTFVRLIAEERLVTMRYPEYADYARRTRRLVPFVL